jgi:hypothetical protein
MPWLRMWRYKLQFFHSANCISPYHRLFLTSNSSVPTQNQVLVPETLLKKRKSQEAARAERRAEAENIKKVGFIPFTIPTFPLPTT